MAAQESSGINLIKRAVELDSEARYEEAMTFYETGIKELISSMKGCSLLTISLSHFSNFTCS